MAIRMQLDSFDGPEALRPVEFEPEQPGAGQVLVRNVAIGVNFFDWKFVSGLGGMPALPVVPGIESAGVVEAVGDGVEFVVGDEVITRRHPGAFATHRLVPATSAWLKPPTIGFDAAAALTVAAGTAWAALATAAVGPEDTVLVHGASGGVGSAAVQLARHLGARVIGTGSEANFGYLRSLGAEPVLYGEGLVDRVRALGGVTAVVDFRGDEGAIAATLALLPNLDRASTAVSGAAEEAGIPKLRASASDNLNVIALACSGELMVEISATFPLLEAADALTAIGGGHTRGKIVLLT